MKLVKILTLAFAVSAAFVFTGCSSGYSDENTPSAVAMNFLKAWSKGDVDGVKKFFEDNRYRSEIINAMEGKGNERDRKELNDMAQRMKKANIVDTQEESKEAAYIVQGSGKKIEVKVQKNNDGVWKVHKVDF